MADSSVSTPPSGEQLAAIANALPPLPPLGLGIAVEVLSILFAVVATISLVLRIYVRTGLSRGSGNVWGVDDYLAVIGFVSITLGSRGQQHPLE